MNHSFHSADRSTHLKIVVVALVAGIAVAGFGIATRTNADFTQTAQTTHVVKAGSTFELVAKNELGEECYASPALSRGRIYLRTAKSLFCIGEASK